MHHRHRLRGGSDASSLHQGPVDVEQPDREEECRRQQVPSGAPSFPDQFRAPAYVEEPVVDQSICLQVLLDTEGIDAYDQASSKGL